MQDMALLRPTMTVQEAAALIGISAPTMYELTEREDFTALIRIGRRKLVLRAKLMEWLEAQATQPQETKILHEEGEMHSAVE